jgi:hypothetical protein
MEILARTIDDSRVISRIHKYLNAGVVIEHNLETTEEALSIAPITLSEMLKGIGCTPEVNNV